MTNMSNVLSTVNIYNIKKISSYLYFMTDFKNVVKKEKLFVFRKFGFKAQILGKYIYFWVMVFEKWNLKL